MTAVAARQGAQGIQGPVGPPGTIINPETKQNSFDGGTLSATITGGISGNSGAGGSGDYFDTVSTPAVFDNAHVAHGSFAAKINNTGKLVWTHQGSQTDAYGRAYMYLPILPTTNPALLIQGYLASTLKWNIGISPSGFVVITAAGNTRGTGVVAITAGQYFRIEWHLNSVSQLVVRLYVLPDSAVLSDTITASGSTNSAIDEVRFQAQQYGTTNIWLDNLVVGQTMWPGPAASVIDGVGVGGDLLGTLPNPTVNWAHGSMAIAGWSDTRAYGALCDALQRDSGAMTAGSNIITAGGPQFVAGNAEVGKRIVLTGAGATLATGNGAISLSGTGKNLLTDASATFTQAMVGRRIAVTGAGSSGGVLKTRVWGVQSATTLRLWANATTAVTGSGSSDGGYVISNDLYGVISSNDATTAHISTDSTGTTPVNAGTTISASRYWYGTGDAAAINAAFAALPSTGGVVYHHGWSMIETTITATNSSHFMGAGGQGYSRLLGQGATMLIPAADGIVLYRFGSGRVFRDAAMTSGSPTLTSASAAFVVGDVGKTVTVLGAGAQTGSTNRVPLVTTVLSVGSSTSCTLNANASTTVSDTYSTVTNASNINIGPAISNIHFTGHAGTLGAIHIINANNCRLRDLTASDFYSGFGVYADGSNGNSQYWQISGLNLNDNRIGFKMFKAGHLITDSLIDGNSNSVGVVPGKGTIGVETGSGARLAGVNIQAYEKMVYADGTASTVRTDESCRFECFLVGVELCADGGASGGNGAYIGAVSWASSSVGGTGCVAVKLNAGVKNTVLNPGFWLPGDITPTDIDGSVTNTIDISKTMIP